MDKQRESREPWNSHQQNGVVCKETDVGNDVAKRVRSRTENDIMPASSSTDEGSISPTKVMNIEQLRAGNNIATAAQDDSPSASPPRKKLISMLNDKLAEEEIKQRVKIAHEIALDSNFRLPDPGNDAPPPSSDESPQAHLKRMEKTVKDIVHRAFWDSLRTGIESEPPHYEHAFVLLQEIKDVLLSLLPTNRVTSFHKRINEYMDLELFQQQAENNALDIKAIATFVVDIMAATCAPVRDDPVAALRPIEDVVDLFKEIHKVLDLMKIDFANFAIKSVRPQIQQQQFEFERSEFAKLLKDSPDGLKKTEEWISSTYQEVCKDLDQLEEYMVKNNTASADSPSKRKFEDIKKSSLSPLSVMKTAYTRLISPDFNLDELPETLQMDRTRIETLRVQVDRIVLVSSVMITCCGVFGQPLASHQAFLTKLKDVLMTLTAPESNKDMFDLLDGISLQCWKEAENYTKGKGPEVERCITSAKQATLKEKLTALRTMNSHPVYDVIYKRTIQYLHVTADVLANHTSPTTPTLPQPPAGVSFVASELVTVALQYAKVINLNKTIYGPFYVPILKEILDIPKLNATNPKEVEKQFSPGRSEEKGARRKLDLAAQNDTADTASGKHKVTGSLADLD